MYNNITIPALNIPNSTTRLIDTDTPMMTPLLEVEDGVIPKLVTLNIGGIDENDITT